MTSLLKAAFPETDGLTALGGGHGADGIGIYPVHDPWTLVVDGVGFVPHASP